jgi:osmotically-inducible protein OsmY
MVVNFDYPIPTQVKTQTTLTTRFSKLANKTQFQGVDIEVDGNRVILRGEVASPQDSKLATILARLEPGVRTVQNELTVAEPPAPAIE